MQNSHFYSFVYQKYGDGLPIGNNKKTAEIWAKSGWGNWTRTNDIRINSKFLISGLFFAMCRVGPDSRHFLHISVYTPYSCFLVCSNYVAKKLHPRIPTSV